MNADSADARHLTTSAADQTVVFSNVPAGQTYTAQVSCDNTGTPDCSGQALAQSADAGSAVAGLDYHLQPVTVLYTSMAGCSAG